MKLLFAMRSTVYVRNFESTLRLLAERGHEVVVVADWHSLEESNDSIRRLCDEYPSVRHVLPPPVAFDARAFLGTELRRSIDYLRYLGPEFAAAAKLKARAERNAPAFVMRALRWAPLRTAPGRRLLAGVLHQADRAVGHREAFEAFVAEHRPDLVMVTPLVEPGGPQAEYLRAARALGIPTALGVYSWDNLTNKGLIHDPLDLVTVWNEPMKREAVSLHGLRPERVVVTGAPSYDHWFGWAPGTSREAFCAQVGLRSDRPYVLYLCSSKFIAPDEVSFVRRWAAALRAASPALAEVGVLVRPHPQNAEGWREAEVGDLGLAVWPRAGANPVEQASRSEYYDSIHHSAAVVGVNTSAQIESAIVGRPVYTVLADEFRDTQDGTLHFHHLKRVNGGLLHVGRDFDEHFRQLEAALSGADDGRCRRFVEAFVRPHGLDQAATPRLVAALERTAAAGTRRPDRGPWWRGLVRPVLARAANLAARTDRAKTERAAAHHKARALRHGQQAILRADVQRAKRREAEAKAETARQQAEAARLKASRAAAAYERYLEIRDWAGRWRQPSEAAGLPLWDATPAMVAGWRRLCERLGHARSCDYGDDPTELKMQLRRRLATLLRASRPLFVPEPEVAGGFGFVAKREGGLYNQDSLRFFEAMVALHDGGVLEGVRSPSRRALVWEIGGGWGGFAVYFTTACPAATYVVTAPPDQLLASAVYVASVRPEARIRLMDEAALGGGLDGWEHADYVFVPAALASRLRWPRLDLVVDLGAVSRLTDADAGALVQQAYDAGTPYWYSMLPTRVCAAAAAAAAARLESRFWVHPIPHRTESELGDASDGAPFVPDHGHDHVVGWRRIVA